MDKFDNSSYKIIHWNCRSIKNKIHELQQLILDFKLDIASLNETHLSNRHKLNIRGFKVYRHDRNQFGGGVALVIKNNIEHYLIKVPELINIEAIGVIVQHASKNVLVISAYLPPEKKLINQDLHKLLSLHTHVLILGDLNCKHVSWNCPTNNQNGKILLDFCLSHNLNLNFPAEPTHYPFNLAHRPSIIDLMITKNFNSHNKPQCTSLNFPLIIIP